MGLFESYVNKFGSPYYNGNSVMTMGEKLKVDSDMLMEDTWWNDP